MVIVMEMSTGKQLEELGDYGEEVLNASWLPQPELGLELQSAVPSRRERREPQDAEAFLRNVYLSQE